MLEKVVFLFLLALPVAAAGEKVASWELCTGPFRTDSGMFNLTTGVTGFNPDQSSTLVRNLYPCPYTAGATSYGTWTQSCTYNLYASRYEGKHPLSTCFNTLVLFGDYAKNSVKSTYTPTSIMFENLAGVGYGSAADLPVEESGESTRLLQSDGEEGGQRSWRWASEAEEDEWLDPTQIDYSSLRIIGGEGKFVKPLFWLSNIKLEQEIARDRTELIWETKIGVYYKRMYWNYNKL